MIDKIKTPCKLLRAIQKVNDFLIELFEQHKTSIALFVKKFNIKTTHSGGVYHDK